MLLGCVNVGANKDLVQDALVEFFVDETCKINWCSVACLEKFKVKYEKNIVIALL